MGWWSAAAQTVRDLVALPRPITLDLQPLTTFDYGPRPIDQLLMAMRTGETRRVSREDALAVPAVQRGRNELAAIATLPLKLFFGQQPVPHPLFAQFDVDVPNVVHLAMTIEDLAFEAIAWWRVTGRLATGYPASVCRIDPDRVHLKNPGTGKADPRYVWVDQGEGKPPEQVPAGDMIRFDSPNPGVLRANARTVRIALKLDRLTEMYADNPALREYFTDNDDHDGDLMKEEDVDGFLAEWTAARQSSPTAWVPGNVKRADVSTPSPKDLTLSDLRQQVNLAIANGLGVDPEDLGVSTTSRTYFNSVDKKQDKINRTYSPFMKAITDRLSMGDVTMRGYAAQFDLVDYLKSDPVTQATYWKALLDMGVVDETWVGDQAGIDPAVVRRAMADPAPAPAGPVQSGRPALRIASSAPAGHHFAGPGPAFVFNAADFAGDAPAAPTVDQGARTITGLAVPYNATANKYGMKYSFAPGSLEYSDPARMAHLIDHTTPVGFHRSVTDSAAGPVVSLAVLDGPDGSPAKAQRDQLLYDAANGLYSGLSVGVDFSMDPEDGDVEYDADTDTYRVVRATWRETSTTYMPAFDDARVTTVAASRAGGTMHCVHCGQAHAPNIACATFARQIAPPAPPAPPAPAGAGQPMTYEQYQAFIAQQAGSAPVAAAPPVATPALILPAGTGPTPVSPHQNAGNAEVIEPLPYRFDRQGNLREGTHDFSTDIARGYNPNYQGDAPDPVAAQARVTAWLKHAFENRDLGRLDAPAGVHDVARQTSQQFAITPANVVNLNYPQNRPDLYVDQLDYLYPMYEAMNKGTLTTVTPFVVPKFNSSSGLVTDHVTGTEPTPGAFTATAQTITPSALSGKVEMTREVLDQGGNPQASGLIWRQMVRGWYEGLEAAAQAFLVAQSASIPDIALGIAVTDSAMDQSLASAVTALQYIRGGDRFQKVYTQIDLYQKLAKAIDTTGRPLYPSFGAMNAAGITDPSYNYLNVRGKTFVPAWATAATGTVAASSWMFDPDVVCLWASTPQRIDIQWRVAWVDIGIWGYKAFAITDFTRTRELVYDPV
jgi:hypothetical protein